LCTAPSPATIHDTFAGPDGPDRDEGRPRVEPAESDVHEPEDAASIEANRFDADRLALACLILLGVVHRGYLFIRFNPALEKLVEASDGWLTWQYFAHETLTQNLLLSLVYLQQTPPIPMLTLGLVLEVFGWPFESTLALLVLQFVISILTSCAMFLLARSWGNGRTVAWAISALFLVSLDLVVMEYNSQAQTFYENLSMLGMVVICWQMSELLKHRRVRSAWVIGVCVACLALTRASYAYFFVLPIGFVLASGIRPRGRLLLGLIVPVLLIHGSWCVKNAWVYGTFSPSTSSWLGSNLVSGLDNFNAGPALRRHIAQQASGRPAWFAAFVAGRGGRNVWMDVTRDPSIPARYRERDAEIQRNLAKGNPPRNSVARRVVSDHYARAYLDFASAHPRLMARKAARAYRLFWQPIRDYSAFHFGGLFFVSRVIHSDWDFLRYFRFLRGGGSQVHLLHAGWTRLASGAAKIREAPRAGGWVAEETASLLVNAINWMTMHTLVLACAAAFLWRRLRGELPAEASGFLFAVAAFCYLAIVSSLAEYGENMRFRLSVEPVIWVLTITSGLFSWRGIRAWRSASKTPPSP
jgi:hypothetical protein